MTIVVLPIRTVSEANAHTHWRVRQSRAKLQRTAARMLGANAVRGVVLPCIVTLTRVAPGMLDSDNLAGSQKHVRDGLADALGIDDGSPLVEWRYAQRKGAPRAYAVEIQIEARGDTP